ncbi:MAG TPA: hypothetical protein VER11_19720, partial [Polyangiaceae bacterium]|nr:hypothetical protein [Polyangiaceae bacterium]
MIRSLWVAAWLVVGASSATACGSSSNAPHSADHGGGSSANGGQVSATAGAANPGSSGQSGASNVSDAGASDGGSSAGTGDALGAYPFAPSTVTRGGTMTFSNVGAAGWWPRRIDREAGDAACDYKDGTDTWGAHCCMKKQATDSTHLAPFDQEMTLILKAINVKQLAVYQPETPSASTWQRVTDWDRRTGKGTNLWFTQKGDGSAEFPGDLTKNDCTSYLSQAPMFACGDGSNYFCPNDPGVLHRGFSGS